MLLKDGLDEICTLFYAVHSGMHFWNAYDLFSSDPDSYLKRDRVKITGENFSCSITFFYQVSSSCMIYAAYIDQSIL